jgi:hypothetical protein
VPWVFEKGFYRPVPVPVPVARYRSHEPETAKRSSAVAAPRLASAEQSQDRSRTQEAELTDRRRRAFAHIGRERSPVQGKARFLKPYLPTYYLVPRSFATSTAQPQRLRRERPASTIPSAGLTCIHLPTVRLLTARRDDDIRHQSVSAGWAGWSLDRRLSGQVAGEGLRWSYNQTVSKYRSFDTLLLIDFGGHRSVARLCGSGYY